MSLRTESCSLPHPLPLCLPPGFLFCLCFFHTHRLLCVPSDGSRPPVCGKGLSWEIFLSDKEGSMSPCCWDIQATDLLLLTLGLSLLSRPRGCTAVIPAVFLRLLSWHQTWFSAANLVQIIFAMFFPGHCLITSSLFPLGFLCGSHLSAGSVCVTVGLVKFWCHSLDILLLFVSTFWFLSVLVSAFHVFQPPWVKSQSNVSKKPRAEGEGRMVWRCPWKCLQAQGELSWDQSAKTPKMLYRPVWTLAKIQFCSESRHCLEFHVICWKIRSFLSPRDCSGPGLPISKQMIKDFIPWCTKE